VYGARIPDETIKTAVELVNEGLVGWREAASRYGMSHTTLRKRAADMKLPRRVGKRRVSFPQRVIIPESDVARAYLAAIVDGEGYIIAHTAHKGTSFQWMVGVTNTSQELISWLHRMGGRVIKRRNRPGKPCFDWVVRSRLDVLAVLEAIEPYMIIKRAKAQEAIRDIRSIIEDVEIANR
jgi:hypothetical protein